MSNRIVLLVTSPRLPAGLLSAEAWRLLQANPVFATAESAQSDALRAAGVTVTIGPIDAPAMLAAARAAGTVVFLAGVSGEPAFARDLGLRLAREPGLAELELIYGSWDPTGARLLDAVTVMDQLRVSDAWKRQQTHESLAPFLLEEAYEAYDAILSGDSAALREELGDVLLQVVLHARLAEELPDGDRYTIDDVAGDLVDKLVRRNPHVYGDEPTEDVEEIIRRWEQIKKAEKDRESVLEGIAWSQPALSLAAKVLSRAGKVGVVPDLPPAVQFANSDELGRQLLAMVAVARQHGWDAEAGLRQAVLALAEAVRAAE